MTGKAIVVVNEKGGVGKTTTSVQLSYELAERGYKVCLVDNDGSGDATKALFGHDVPDCIALANKPEGKSNTLKMYLLEEEFEPVEICNNFDFMGAGSNDALAQVDAPDLDPAFRFESSIEMMLEVYDFVIIDCPPSFGMLFTAAILAAEKGGALIPYEPEDFGVSAAHKMVKRISDMNKRMRRNIKILGFLANGYKVNPKPESVDYFISEMEEAYGAKHFKAHRHDAVAITNAIALKVSLREVAKKGSKALVQLDEFVDEFLERVE